MPAKNRPKVTKKKPSPAQIRARHHVLRANRAKKAGSKINTLERFAIKGRTTAGRLNAVYEIGKTSVLETHPKALAIIEKVMENPKEYPEVLHYTVKALVTMNYGMAVGPLLKMAWPYYQKHRALGCETVGAIGSLASAMTKEQLNQAHSGLIELKKESAPGSDFVRIIDGTLKRLEKNM